MEMQLQKKNKISLWKNETADRGKREMQNND